MATLLGLLEPEDGGTRFLIKFSNYLTVNRHTIPRHFNLHHHHHENLNTHTHIFIISTADIHEQKNDSK